MGILLLRACKQNERRLFAAINSLRSEQARLLHELGLEKLADDTEDLEQRLAKQMELRAFRGSFAKDERGGRMRRKKRTLLGKYGNL